MADEMEPLPEPDPSMWADRAHDTALAELIIRTRRRDPCAERVAIELDRRRTMGERIVINEKLAVLIHGAVVAVFDALDLTPEQRERANAIAADEFRRLDAQESE